jgi:hypothetical protein
MLFSGPIQPKMAPLDFDSIPQSVAAHISVCRNELENLEFKLLGVYDRGDSNFVVRSTIALFKHPAEKTWAWVVVFENFKSTSLGASFIEFESRFSDGMRLFTNNYKRFADQAHPAGHRTFQLPMTKNASLLYRAHNHLKNKHFANKPPIFSFEEEGIKFLESSFREARMHEIEVGYIYLNRSGTKYRLTLKGAILTIWKDMWPVCDVRRIMRHIKARNILSEMDA